MQKWKEAFFNRVRQHRVGLACFVFILLYQWLIVNNGSLLWVYPAMYTQYLVDYSMGFCSRLLPGAIYHALADGYDHRSISLFVAAFFVVLTVLLSFFMERFYEAADAGERKTALLLMFFFLTGPFTLGLFVRGFGMLDFYWCFFFALAFPLLPRKRLKWLLPVFIACMILVHYAVLFCYAALLLLLVFFFAAKAEDRAEKRSYYILFAVCFLVTVGLAGYFILFDTENTTYSATEFERIVRERGAPYPEYFMGSLYRITDPTFSRVVYHYGKMTVDASATGLSRFAQWIAFFFWGALENPHPYIWQLLAVLLALPAAVVLVGLLVSYFRAGKGNREARFAALLLILFFFGGIFVSVFLSSDTFRWLSHAVACLFIGTFAVLYYDYREGFRKARAFIGRAGLPFILVYAVVYALTTMDPYV